MELLLLDKNFQICGLVDDFSSLVWNRKYYECGNFSLETNVKYLEQFKNAKYIYNKNFLETGVLEGFNFKDTTTGLQILFKGRFLESVLSERVIDKTQNFTNVTTENIVCNLVNTFAINTTGRTIEKLKLGEKKGLGKSRTIQMTGDNLLNKIYELCKEDELSIRLKYDFDNNQIIFGVWQGLDRTDNQNANTWAIFSRNFENILQDEYSIDITKYCNFAYVAGEDKGENRVIVEVNQIKPNEERRELYVDARDLQKDDKTTDIEYRQILRERGIQKLGENNKIETANFSIDPLANLIYKQDFDLGDKVIYKNEQLNFNIENRIIGISEAYENGNRTLDVTFGEDFNIKKIKEMI